MQQMARAAELQLIEQMGLSDREIARRLHLLNFTDEDRERILIVRDKIVARSHEIVEEYYEFQLADPDIASVIGDIDTLKRLKKYMLDYIASLFSGVIDAQYVNTRLRIGKVHKRLDVRPKLYMKAHAKLQNILDREVEACSFSADAIIIKQAIHKILLFDAELVFDAYVEAYLTEMQTATREVEKYASQVGIKLDSMFSRLHEKSQKDALTGLHNRRALYDYLKHESQVAERHHLSFVLIYMDLNNFKTVNDLHGHQAGDDVLAQVGRTLVSQTRAVDIPARYGGDEFCIIMPRTNLNEVEIPLRRIASDFDAHCNYPVTFSMGVVQVGPTFFEEPEELIQIADRLMYEAKQRAHRDGQHHWHFEGKNETVKNR
ncbi:MAG: GGDEF domain-containing protein [Sneathiella sp.]|nr:GGDEF domain-containing protein [Sneathiella sp.]